MPSPVILILAGEPSGDQHGAALASALRARMPGCRLLGTGGERMAAEGVELLAGLDELAVMGFVEVAVRLPYFWRLERRVLGVMSREQVDLVIPVDYPGFNLRIARRAREMGVPVVYYIAPQVWAWKAHRAARLARDADRIAVILPFEEEIFTREGGHATFVGHPLLERDDDVQGRAEFCRAVGLDPDRPILALFPGSRRQEIQRHLGPFLDAAARLTRQRPELQVALARGAGLELTVPAASGVVLVDDSRALLRHARAAIVKSGTTTLEAALEGTPFIVAYRTHPLTFALARRLVRVDHVALANLVAEDRVVPEILQGEVTGERLARELLPLLDDSPERRSMLEGLSLVRGRLGDAGAAERVAGLASELLGDSVRSRGGTP
jgi:lipid-A-disaccharide synthase